MVKLLNINKQTLNLIPKEGLRDYYIETNLETADKLIHFFVLRDNAQGAIQENYIQTEDDLYVIKEVNRSDANWVEVFGKLDTDALKATVHQKYDSTEQDISVVLAGLLGGTGWTYQLHDLPSKRRTVRMEDSNTHSIILSAMKTYGYEVEFSTLDKKVHVYQTIGEDRGAYVYSDLNIRNLELQADTYDFATRLYAYGAEGLTFADINGGKEYVSNHNHSTKIIEAVWRDDRYTDKASLKADAEKRLEILAQPRLSYTVDVIELAKLSNTYSILDFRIGDSVAIIDRVNSLRDYQRITKLTDYPITPEKNKVELANVKITMVESTGKEAIDSAIAGVKEYIVKVETDLMKAIDDATDLITNEKGGYIVIRTNEAGEQYEFLVMDTADIATATNVWRWNLSGLGFSSSGYNGDYGIAITADGKINADFITTGELNAERVKTGLLSSKDSRTWIDLDTGYFKLGGISYDATGFQILFGGKTVEEVVKDKVDEVGIYKIDIISTNGNIFKNDNIYTTLIARVYKNNVDITDTINAQHFKWKKINQDGTPDTVWNNKYIGGSKQVSITGEEVYNRASFTCEITEV